MGACIRGPVARGWAQQIADRPKNRSHLNHQRHRIKASHRRSRPDVIAFDTPLLGALDGQRVLHLQCHIGTDTLSLARLGALNWLPDIARWAEVAAALVRPGGRLHLRESYPMAMTLDDERDDDLLCVKYPYFETEAPMTFDQNETYVDTGGGTVEHGVTHEWNHGIGEVFTALTNAGLVVTTLKEHRHLDWRFLPQQVEIDELFYMPEHQRDLIPWQYTMQATKS